MTIANRKVRFKNIGYRFVFLAFALSGLVLARIYVDSADAKHVIVVDIPPPLDTEIGDREINNYDFGGSVANCSAIYYGEEDKVRGTQCYEALDMARDFIEEHFKNRRRGYVILDSPSSDSIGTNYIFIEPGIPNDESAGWEVRIRKRVPGPYTWANRNVNTWYYTEVFRRRSPKDSFYFPHATSALILRSRNVYELIL